MDTSCLDPSTALLVEQALSAERHGWLLLVLGLTALIIALVMIWLFSATSTTTTPTDTTCFGQWGVLPSRSAPIINNCGESRTLPCTFNVTTLASAVQQCTALACNSFIYNEVTGQMSIVDTGQPTFEAPQIDLFIQQNGVLP